jgi:drug/metabolite transporter, DME family
MNASRGIWLILLAAVLWGTTGTSQALMPDARTPMVVGALRLLIGGASLVLLSFLRGNLRLRGTPLPFILLAGICVALYQVCFFWAVSRTGVAAGTIVGIGSSPIFAGLLDWSFRGQRPGRRWYLSTLIAIFGCALLILSSGNVQIDMAGIGLAMAAGLAYASYALIAKIILPGQSSENVTALVFSVGAILLLPLLFSADLSWLAQTRGWLPILHLGVIATALSYWLFTRGLQVVPVSTAVTLSLAEPMTAGLLGVMVVGERLSLPAWCGLLLILAALMILVVPQKAVTIRGEVR